MASKGFRVIDLNSIPPVADHGLELDADWRPVRHHLGVDVFGINAYTATDRGQVVIEEHDEDGDPAHHELYFVHAGRARFTVGEDTFDAPAGTFVYLEDPAVVRKAVADEPGTTGVAVRAAPGVPFEPSEWERRRLSAIEPVA